MEKKNAPLKIDLDFFISITENTLNSYPEYQKAQKRFDILFKSLQKKNLIDEAMEVDSVVTSIDTAVREAVYKAAFQDGMKFILNAMAGKEVICI